MSKYSPLRRFALITILSGMLAWLGQPFIHGNEKAIDIIIYVFSILSGFLIAIMTLFGDIKYNQNVNWRKLQLQENASKQRYSKHFLLFYGYLSVLISVFISVLAPAGFLSFFFFLNKELKLLLHITPTP